MQEILNFTNEDFLYLFAFGFGTVVGSFLNVCIYRLPREESIVFPPSHCTSCKNPIRFYHNVPVLSYFLLGGKCRNCGKKISQIYPLVELLTGIITALLVFKLGLTVKSIVYLLFIYSLIVITFIDIKYMIIPNLITFPGIIAGFIFSLFITDFAQASRYIRFLDVFNVTYITSNIPALDSFLGIIVGGGALFIIAFVYKYFRKIEGMGMGDVKLLAMMGAFLGLNGVFFIIFFSSLVGSIVGVSIILYKKGDLKYAIPFGPFLSLSAVVFILTGGFNFFFLGL